ncbi:MAG TPA: M23 family metallopeptidase [Anaerolineaceae bacterium]|nr:M23 family metallopeptidase [Anaerolineaceae bacterium]
MKFWPVPNSFSRDLPTAGRPGCFWQDRGDRYHAGVDIYAPSESEVVAFEDGVVLSVELFTSPAMRVYWNNTYAIVIQNATGQIVRYAEMASACVEPGNVILGGQVIGHVGQVLEPERIDSSAPHYIQALKENGIASMLHIEVHATWPIENSQYLGGNYFTPQKPAGLINPEILLIDLIDNHPQKNNGGI